MTAILLIPLKLIVKAAAYVFAAVLGTVAIIITIASAIIRKIAGFIGGLAVIGSILMAVMAAADAKTILIGVGLGIAIILIPTITDSVSNLICSLRTKILEGAADIELI